MPVSVSILKWGCEVCFCFNMGDVKYADVCFCFNMGDVKYASVCFNMGM